jgi:hypothetical protein
VILALQGVWECSSRLRRTALSKAPCALAYGLSLFFNTLIKTSARISGLIDIVYLFHIYAKGIRFGSQLFLDRHLDVG